MVYGSFLVASFTKAGLMIDRLHCFEVQLSTESDGAKWLDESQNNLMYLLQDGMISCKVMISIVDEYDQDVVVI